MAAGRREDTHVKVSSLWLSFAGQLETDEPSQFGRRANAVGPLYLLDAGLVLKVPKEPRA